MANRTELLGRWGCYHCGHDQHEHNLIQGCPHCKCAATPGEAGTDPTGQYKDQRVRTAAEPPLHDWQKFDPEPVIPAYDHPELILHIPDFYGEGTSHKSKWKDRFSTSVKTAATSLITYLEWPGDKRGMDGWTRKQIDDATELGPFAVYRIDKAATAKLRAEMEKMDPAKRLDQVPASRYGHSYSRRTTNKKFAAGLREAIERSLR